MRKGKLALVLFIAWSTNFLAYAQLDPAKRELIQLGYNQPIRGHAPLSAYAFYYINIPEFIDTNLTFRLALAPVYLLSEIGFKEALGKYTDLGVELAGGGFADSYSELRRGKFVKEESFTGHGGGSGVSVYHLFNPGQQIPLNGILRGEAHYTTFSRDSATDDNFELPSDQGIFRVRSGFRYGGQEPLILPDIGMEVSAWYEGQFRTDPGSYGFNNDREIESDSHLFWSRALLTYTLPKLHHNFNVNVTLGTVLNPDRFSAYRLGGALPLASEFPLGLPGYYFQEISARNFVLFGGAYSIPLDRKNTWSVRAFGAAAAVDYLPGLRQPSTWLRGVGTGINYRSPTRAWQIVLTYGYGFDAIRGDDRGAHNVGFLVQFDLERANMNLFEPGENPLRSRGLERIWDALHLF